MELGDSEGYFGVDCFSGNRAFAIVKDSEKMNVHN